MRKKAIIRLRKQVPPHIRTRVYFDTGTRIHRPLKGKGAYRRKPKHPQHLS